MNPIRIDRRRSAPALLAAAALPAWAQQEWTPTQPTTILEPVLVVNKVGAAGESVARSGLTQDYQDGPAFQQEVVEAYEVIGKAIAK